LKNFAEAYYEAEGQKSCAFNQKYPKFNLHLAQGLMDANKQKHKKASLKVWLQ